MPPLNILVIDDDPAIRRLLGELLSGKPDYRVLLAGDGKQAVRCFAEERVDLVLTDIHMPGVTGLELVADMQKIKFKPEILVMTANATPENVEMARQIGARSVILKPFDNLDVVEAEIEKAVRAVLEARSGGGPVPSVAAAAPKPPPAPAPVAHPAPIAPPAPVVTPAPPRPPAAASLPAPVHHAPPHAAQRPAPQPPAAVPDFDAWSGALTGNETPPPEAGSETMRHAPPAAAHSSERPTAAPPSPSPAIRPAPAPARPAPPPARPAPPVPAAATPRGPSPGPTGDEAGVEVSAMPAELEEIFQLVGNLELSRLQMQVPIICLETWEEAGAIGVLKSRAQAVSREFYTWSASKGIVKDGQAIGEMYRDPSRALEFIRRQRASGLFVLADFRQCLEDRTVVRELREMVMEGETGRHVIVLTAPRLPIPPELQPSCAVFAWPSGSASDTETLYNEIVAEVSASSGRPVSLDRASRAALLARVKEMPSGRARFEMARVLLAVARKAS